MVRKLFSVISFQLGVPTKLVKKTQAPLIAADEPPLGVAWNQIFHERFLLNAQTGRLGTVYVGDHLRLDSP